MIYILHSLKIVALKIRDQNLNVLQCHTLLRMKRYIMIRFIIIIDQMKKKNDYPRRLNNKLSMKEIEKCYRDEIELIEYKAKWRKSPYRVP